MYNSDAVPLQVNSVEREVPDLSAAAAERSFHTTFSELRECSASR